MSEEQHGEESRASRFFTTEAVAEDLSGKKKAKTKRAAKEPAPRHDFDDVAPVDGDYEKLALENKDPDMEYFWASDRDLQRLRRPWVAEKWGRGCARPKFALGGWTDGEDIVMDGLHLMKMPKSVAEEVRRRDPNNYNHRKRMKMLIDVAKEHGRFEQTVSSFGADELEG